jgi:hypothetical protein
MTSPPGHAPIVNGPNPIAGQLLNGPKAAITIRRRTVRELWLSGVRPGEIAIELGMTIAQVTGDIRVFRGELLEENKASIQEHAEQTVAIFRKVLGHLWDELEAAQLLGDRLKIYDLMRKVEESTAKVRGLLTSRVIADVRLTVKMYDFEDTLPAAALSEPIKTIGEDGIELPYNPRNHVPKIIVPQVPEPSDDLPGFRQPPSFDLPKAGNGFLLPDGSFIEVDEDSEWQQIPEE